MKKKISFLVGLFLAAFAAGAPAAEPKPVYKWVSANEFYGGKSGTLKPALGFKVGYIFEGFWTTKEEKSAK